MIEDEAEDLVLLDDVVGELLGVRYLYVLEERGGEFLNQFVLADDCHLHQHLVEQVEVDDGRGLHHFLHAPGLVEDGLPPSLVAVANLQADLLQVHEYLGADGIAEPLCVGGQLCSLFEDELVDLVGEDVHVQCLPLSRGEGLVVEHFHPVLGRD